MPPLDTELEQCLAGIERALSPAEDATLPTSPSADASTLDTPQAFWEFVQASQQRGEEKAARSGSGGEGEGEGAGDGNGGLGRTDAGGMALVGAQMERLESYLSRCGSLRLHLVGAAEVLEGLEEQHDLVSSKTNSLHETCKKLLAEQAAFDNVVAEIEAPLTFLRELDRISALFGVSIASPLQPLPNGRPRPRQLHPDSEAFSAALRRVDECIDYVEANVSCCEGEA